MKRITKKSKIIVLSVISMLIIIWGYAGYRFIKHELRQNIDISNL